MTSGFTPTTTNLSCGCNAVISTDHKRADIELCPIHASGPALLDALKREHAKASLGGEVAELIDQAERELEPNRDMELRT